MNRESLVKARHTRKTVAAVIAFLLLGMVSNPLIGQRGMVGAQSASGLRGLQFDVSFPASVSPDRQNGHIILIVSRDTTREPRFQYQVYNPDVQPGFGLDRAGEVGILPEPILDTVVIEVFGQVIALGKLGDLLAVGRDMGDVGRFVQQHGGRQIC